MTEGKLARWLKKVGDDVRAGDVIAEIETDKATMEVEAVDEGKLAQILVAGRHRGRGGEHADRRAGAERRGRSADGAEAARRRLPKAAAAGSRAATRPPQAAAPARRRGGAGEGLGPDQADHRARGAARRHGAGDARATTTCS